MPHHLLLADDSVTIQRVIKLTFADEDVEVVTVGDGDQAVAAIDKAPPDIVLADVAMPGRSGYDVARHIRETPHLSHIPVVLLTGAFEPVDEGRAAKVGCDAVLSKPFEPDTVVSRVRELLARPRAAGESDGPTPAAPSAASTPAPAVPVSPPAAAAAVQALPPVAKPAPFPAPAVVAAPVPAAIVPAAPAASTPSPLPATPVLPPPSPVPAAAPLVPGPLAAVPPAGPAVPAAASAPVSQPAQGGAAAESSPARGAAAPSRRSAADIDAYFDRLDEAFASLATAPRTAPPPSPESRPAPALSLVPPTPRPAPAEPGDAAVSSLVEAFEGLLPPTRGAEPAHGDGTPERPAAPSPRAGEVVLSDAQIEQIVDRVYEQLTTRLRGRRLEDLVAEAAERVVRAEIDQIKRRL